jgi:hypothetical protein
MNISHEISMELLTDLATALRNVAKDALSIPHQQVMIQTAPPGVVLQVPPSPVWPRKDPLYDALYDLAKKTKQVTDAALPSLSLQYRIIGGSEAAGIEITVKPGGKPVYGNIIKAKLAWIAPSKELRRQRPYLPERIDL